MSASKFTRENRGALIERTAAGVPLTDAARALDLRVKTVKGCLTRGQAQGRWRR
jgi:DNA-directed RNA polymerase specialized sigma24 family protein